MEKVTLKIEYVKAPVKPLNGEDWAVLKINSHSDYLISTKGRLYSYRSDRLLKGRIQDGHKVHEYTPTMDKNPIPPVREKAYRKNLKRLTIKQTFQRLVAFAFIPRPAACNMVIHKDYNKLNNNVENLKWIKAADGWKHSTNSPEYKKPGRNRKLSESDVKEIRKLMSRKNRLPVKDVASMFNVTQMTIFRTVRGSQHKNVGGKTRPINPVQRLDDDTVAKVKAMLQAGERGIDIANELSISEQQVSRIKNKKYYKSK